MIVPIQQCITDYLIIARQHQNQWVDILRHLAWMTKYHLRGNNVTPKNTEKPETCNTTTTQITENDSSAIEPMQTRMTEEGTPTKQDIEDESTKNYKKIRAQLFQCHDLEGLVYVVPVLFRI